MRVPMQRGMTIPELLISMGILLLVLGLATELFKQAFTHTTLTSQNMTNEQLTRIAMAKINNSLSQASVDANTDDTSSGTPSPAVISAVPTTTSSPAITFYRVTSLEPAPMPTNINNAPNPLYNVHIISYDSAGQQLNEYVMSYAAYKAAAASPAPIVLAQNVTDFGVMQVNPSEFQFQITVNNIQNVSQAESPYTLVDNVHLMN